MLKINELKPPLVYMQEDSLTKYFMDIEFAISALVTMHDNGSYQKALATMAVKGIKGELTYLHDSIAEILDKRKTV